MFTNELVFIDKFITLLSGDLPWNRKEMVKLKDTDATFGFVTGEGSGRGQGVQLIATEVLPKPREISCHWRRRLKRCGGLKKGGKRANDSSVAAVHDVPGTPGKHLRAMLQCGSILEPGDFCLSIC